MKKKLSINILVFYTVLLGSICVLSNGTVFGAENWEYVIENDSLEINIGRPKLADPESFKPEIKYDPTKGYYKSEEKIGENILLKHPTIMTKKEYSDYMLNVQMREHYKNKTDILDNKKESATSSSSRLLPIFTLNSEIFRTIFGGEEIDINFKGNLGGSLSIGYQYVDNPILSEQNRGNVTTDMELRIAVNTEGKIGTRLKFSINYDTQATFSFQNQMKLNFEGEEDDIIKNLEIGNVSLPLNSNIIRGAQSLFGFKTVMQFGNTKITGVASQQQSEVKSINTSASGSFEEFEVYCADYEDNRHFFLAQYFYDNYDEALKNIPYINSLVNITKIEIWATNKNVTTENTRNIVGFMDIGEVNPYRVGLQEPNIDDLPKNEANKLNPVNLPSSIRNLTTAKYTLEAQGLLSSEDFVILENARLLDETEYTLSSKLGYISLNHPLTADQVLIVSFQYTYAGKVYQVGEFSTDGIDAPNSIYGKLLKSDITSVKLPIWKLMMKNIYNLNSFGITSEDFRFNVFYFDDEKGLPLNYLRDENNPMKDEILLKIFGFDKLNKNGDPTYNGDGYFDYLEGITIDSYHSNIIFPMKEPFGEFLKSELGGDVALEDKYVYEELYDSTKFVAKQSQRLNKFLLKGKYKKGNGADGKGVISLGSMNISEGSVKVTSNGRELVEGVDYTVDYNLGQVKIINESLIVSNAPIEVNLENNNLFGLQTRTFYGINIEQKISDNLVIGGSYMNLRERPFTQKANIGYEPISNSMLGINFHYQDEVPYITKFVDYIIPYKKIEEKSNISFKGEYAKLIPGSPNTFEVAGEPAAYIDDFEAAQYDIDLKGQSTWFLSGSPYKSDSFKTNATRARFSWYVIDVLFFNNTQNTPQYMISNKDFISSHKTRQVRTRELYPQTDIVEGLVDVVNTLDMAFFPNERGPYNYSDSILNGDGEFIDNNPQQKWAGITKSMSISNFEEANVENIQFWVMDPFLEDTEHEGFKLFFNLGNVSEDVLGDGRKSFENGLPEDGVFSEDEVEETTDPITGKTIAFVPKNKQDLSNAFSGGGVENQDVGIDGMSSGVEQSKYSSSISTFSQDSKLWKDPSGDDFFHYRSSVHDQEEADIIQRYKLYNNPEGNTSASTMPQESYSLTARNNPDTEDINKDQTVNTTEGYYEYELDINKNTLNIDNPHITDVVESNIEVPNGEIKTSRWYQFKIPVSSPTRTVGSISDLRSVRFVRMYVSDSKDPVVLRFAELKLMRSEWRKYTKDFKDPSEESNLDLNSSTNFEVGTVNIEENSFRQPIHYILPPGIERQETYSNTSLIRDNEQSLSLVLCDLESKDSRAVFKETKFDFRRYEKLKMFVHLEGADQNASIADNEISLFVRIGGDLNLNYYEYEIPLKATDFTAISAEEIWMSDNALDLDLSVLTDLKIERDKAINGGILASADERYVKDHGKNKVYIKGYPSYASVKNIMIGVKNNSLSNKCLEVWVNELRLTGLDKKGGWASYGQINTNLSNFADVSLVGKTSSYGFGSIEESNSERSIDDIKQYDFTSTVNLGILLPDNDVVKLNMPFFYNISEIYKTPLYDPLRPDIEMSKSLSELEENEREELLFISRDYTRNMNFNFANVKLETTGEKNFYDVSNFAFSYSHNSTYSRNIDTEFFNSKQRSASLIYSHSTGAKPVMPFRGLIENRNLDLIRNFNFYYLPTSVSFKIDGQRDYTEEKFRDLDDDVEIKMPTNYIKKFTLNYEYGINFNVTKNLRFNYMAGRNNIIDEPEGEVNEEARDSIWKNVLVLGRPTRFNQSLNSSYKVPLDEIPLTRFLSSDISYTTNYQWTASSLVNRSLSLENGETVDLGNSIQNSRNININAKADFKKIYKSLEESKRDDDESKKDILDKIKNKQSLKDKDDEGTAFTDGMTDFIKNILTSLKDVSFNYSLNEGTFLPGFLPDPGYFGRSSGAPTFGFLFGAQTDIRYEAVKRGWLTSDAIMLNETFMQNKTENIDFKAVLEPLPKFKINLSANSSLTKNVTENYEVVKDNNNSYFNSLNTNEGGAFSISFISVGTSYSNPDELFRKYITNTKIIAEQKAYDYYGNSNYPIVDSTGYPEGFGKTHSEVLISSFLYTYSGYKSTSILNKIPLPNWNISYSGLTDIELIKKYFKKITITHKYSSVYNVSSFQNDLNYQEGVMNASGNYLSEYTYGNVSIVETFSPLVGVNINMKNSLSIKSNYNKDRSLSLSLNNNSVNEIHGEEYVLGVGYIFKDVEFIVRTETRRIKIKSDINFKTDFSIRSNKTIMRKIVEEDFQITAGEKVITLRSSVDYRFSSKFILMLFFEYSNKQYEISTSYPTRRTNFGVNARFNLD